MSPMCGCFSSSGRNRQQEERASSEPLGPGGHSTDCQGGEVKSGAKPEALFENQNN